MGGAIQKGKERLEHGNTLTGLVFLVHTQYRLRFIDNHDRMGLCQHVDRTAGAELITAFEDDAGCLVRTCALTLLLIHRCVECLGIDNHHVHACIAGKGIYLTELLGVIHKVLHALAVFLGKMFLHALKTLQYAFSDGDAWHYHHKLGPAIAGIQLIHGLDIGIGFTRTRLHFDGEGGTYALQLLQLFYRFQSLFCLYGSYILADGFRSENDVLVTKAFYNKEVLIYSLVHDMVALSVAFGLTCKGISHSQRRFGLEALMFISEFHRLKSL